MDLRVIDRWHKTRLGHLVFALAELGLAYLLVTLAIDSGSLWQWTLAIILIAGFFHNLVLILWVYKK